MVEFEFSREFRHWAARLKKRCVLCKALTLFEYKPGRVEVSEEVAAAAVAAGAGTIVGAVEPVAQKVVAEKVPPKSPRKRGRAAAQTGAGSPATISEGEGGGE